MSICVFHVTEYVWWLLGLTFSIQKDALPLCGLSLGR